MKCPCNPTELYKNCCQKAHKNIYSVSSAEQLMRSRYSAFVLADIKYLHKSHHSSTRLSKKEYKELEKWTKSVKWINLEIVNASEKNVAFKAYFMENGVIDTIIEDSNFCLENNYWVYLNAK
ncbi:YchJ family protein [Polaribacter ponticola]|uniref:YchJ family metal-binding protein n=1 Tax=Polaribacter ponticola TaxID=2978475 RepID=A0ABT5S8C5_9FLAO|nr:YchJ family metal-binding protein [Polaribacter sp. MSW5]MDD7914348.1 YchJ family metal-binding protein [Polaribacter sp. MSW5]